ncbi:hypothetical protein V5F89_12515 [Pelagerythrobacter marensis]|uniref:Nucleotide exchange factor GrpE n=1 Tax=Pelagerythrobacter marensis TaxID=543877 RepID=A0ABZ2D6U4_9SPHN
MSEEVQPLTPEEETQLTELQYRQAMTEWQTADDAREAELASLAPVVGALGDAAAIESLASTLEGAIEDLAEDNAKRLTRIVQILRFDAVKLANRHSQLQHPAPQPEAPPVPEPTA